MKTEEGVINLALAMLGKGGELKRLMNMKLEFPNDSVSHTEHVRGRKGVIGTGAIDLLERSVRALNYPSLPHSL